VSEKWLRLSQGRKEKEKRDIERGEREQEKEENERQREEFLVWNSLSIFSAAASASAATVGSAFAPISNEQDAIILPPVSVSVDNDQVRKGEKREKGKK
jgi:hypothetical protein